MKITLRRILSIVVVLLFGSILLSKGNIPPLAAKASIVQSSPAPTLQVLLPLYQYPVWWDPATYVWDEVAASGNTVPITAIINPNSGPDGGPPNDDYIHGMAELNAANIQMIGYVMTNYGSRNIDDVKADVDLYDAHFRTHGMQGIFFDQVSSSATELAYYQELYNYVKTQTGLAQVFLNAGTQTDEQYVSQPVGDVLIIADGVATDWSTYQVDDYVSNYSATQFGALIFASSSDITIMQAHVDQAVARNVGYFYLTDDGNDGNPWDSLPSFWHEMLAYMAQINANTAGFCSSVTDIPLQECLALETLYVSTMGDSWTDNTGWLQSTQVCTWVGITCNPNKENVIRVILPNKNLQGTIPSEVGDLAHLIALNLNRNQIGGNIPPEIGNLTELRHLNLWKNKLTGPIPAELGMLANLVALNLFENQLSGEIPESIANLTSLVELNLYNNQLTGPIPSTLGSLANLQTLVLGTNQLSGTIPSALGSLPNLVKLTLGPNQLTGEIPKELGELTNLQELALVHNQLSGEIPAELGALSNLRQLKLFVNQLTGPIPPLDNLTNLEILTLSDNNLTGTIPASVGKLANLKTLTLNHNQLTGSIPPEIGNLAQLEWLSLAVNQLSGEIPPALGNLASLKMFHFWRNELTGPIPPELGNLSNLQFLYLSENELTGSIPPALGQLSNLTLLQLEDNQLEGTLPTTFGNLSSLQHLRIGKNLFSGDLPQELTNLIQLSSFWFDNTSLCEPNNQAFSEWLGGIGELRNTDVPCRITLALAKRVTPEEVLHSDLVTDVTVTVQITLTAEAATTFAITDSVPSGLTYIAGSATGGFSYDQATNTLSHSASITPGNPLYYSYQAQVDSSNGPGAVINIPTTVSGIDAQTVSGSATVVIPDIEAYSTLVLIYVGADNDLGDDAVRLLNNAEKATAVDSSVKTIILIDGPGTDDTRLYYVEPDPVQLSCPNYQNLDCNGRYQLNHNFFEWTDDTANVHSLSNFIEKSITAHPNAQTVVLSLVGHGSGWSPDLLPAQPRGISTQPRGISTQPDLGLLWDQSTVGSLSTAELRQALHLAFTETGKLIDLLYLDACSMAMTEVAYELHGYVHYLLASASFSWASFTYDALLAAIEDGMTGAEIGVRWLDAEAETLAAEDGVYPYTFSLIDVGQMANVMVAHTALTNALIAVLESDSETADIDNAVANTTCFDTDYNGTINRQDSFCDLGSLARELGKTFPVTSSVKNAADNLGTLLDSAVVYGRHKDGTPWWPGGSTAWNLGQDKLTMSIYLPVAPRRDEARRRFYTRNHLTFVAETKWDEFLSKSWGGNAPPTTTFDCQCHAAIKPPPLQPTIQLRPGKTLVQPDETVGVYIDLANLDIHRGFGHANLNINYDPSLLQITQCDPQSAVDQYIDILACNPETAGSIRIAMGASAGIISDTVAAQITFTARSSITGTSPLDIQVMEAYDAHDTLIFARGVDSSITVGAQASHMAGDVNCSNTRNLQDAILVMRFAVGMINASSECPPPEGTLYIDACDMNNDGKCDGPDAFEIARCTIGSCASAANAQDESNVTERIHESAQSPLSTGKAAFSGDTATIPLLATTVPNLLGMVTAEVWYDPSHLQVTNCHTPAGKGIQLGICNPNYDRDGVELDAAKLIVVDVDGIAGETQIAQLTFKMASVEARAMVADGNALTVRLVHAADATGTPMRSLVDALFLPILMR